MDRTRTRTRSRRGVCRGVLALTLLCSALALVPGPAQARHPNLELDELDEETLGAMILAEVDDDDLIACGIGNPRAAVGVEKLYNVVMCALGDGGDSGDERGLDFDDLEYEMNEADTSVADVVWAAIQLADELASGERLLPARRIAVVHRDVGSAVAGRWSTDEHFAFDDEFVNPATTFRVPLKQGLTRGVKSRRVRNN